MALVLTMLFLAVCYLATNHLILIWTERKYAYTTKGDIIFKGMMTVSAVFYFSLMTGTALYFM